MTKHWIIICIKFDKNKVKTYQIGHRKIESLIFLKLISKFDKLIPKNYRNQWKIDFNIHKIHFTISTSSNVHVDHLNIYSDYHRLQFMQVFRLTAERRRKHQN